jgi:hypothetical protein
VLSPYSSDSYLLTTALLKTANLDLLDSLAYAIGQRAPARAELYKVRAHIGCEGNEFAYAGAKRVASGDTSRELVL